MNTSLKWIKALVPGLVCYTKTIRDSYHSSKRNDKNISNREDRIKENKSNGYTNFMDQSLCA